MRDWLARNSIWGFAFGYFSAYVPYSLLTKLLTKGLVPGANHEVLQGLAILPISTMASLIAMLIFISAMGWWKHATQRTIRGVRVPTPTKWTMLSGICAAGTIATTTLAYTFEGVSIVFAMLLMRGGVLIIAPIVDTISKRKVRWFSWMGLALSLGALLVSLADSKSYAMPTLCAVDIAVYLASYFVRLRFMSRLAKSADGEANKRYFVEEQMIATPFLLLLLVVVGLLGTGKLGSIVWSGFVDYWHSPLLWAIVLVGVLSQGTGIFGNLIYLDARENAYCVPVNRSSSILAGVVASYLLAMFPGQHPPKVPQLIGAGLIIVAILFLTLPPLFQKKQRVA